MCESVCGIAGFTVVGEWGELVGGWSGTRAKMGQRGVCLRNSNTAVWIKVTINAIWKESHHDLFRLIHKRHIFPLPKISSNLDLMLCSQADSRIQAPSNTLKSGSWVIARISTPTKESKRVLGSLT